MKYLYRILATALLLCPFLANGQNGFNLVQSVKNDSLCIEIFYIDGGTSDTLGSSNLRINFDTTSLDRNGVTISYRGKYDALNSAGYKSMTLTTVADTFFSLNIYNDNGTGFAPAISPYTEHVATICIPIKNSCGTSGVSWRETFPPEFPFTTVNEYNGSQMVVNSYLGDDPTFPLSSPVVVFLPDVIGCDSVVYSANTYYGDVVIIDTLAKSVGCGDSVNIINIVINTSPVVQLGADTVVCEGQIIDLSNITTDQMKLLSSDGVANDWFGFDVSISGTKAIVGAYKNTNVNGVEAGAVYAYELQNGIWIFKQKIIAPGGSSWYGYTVSVDGNNMAVGAYTDAGGVGSVYVYEYNAGSWIFKQTINASDGMLNDYFGQDVCINGNRLIVGAPWDDTKSGSAYIYELQGGVWGNEQKIIPSDRYNDDMFGGSVSISGITAIVGKQNDDSTGVGANAGSAYIFELFGGGGWVQSEKIIPSDAAIGDNFGKKVSLSGNHAIVGTNRKSGFTGAAYIYERQSGVWVETILNAVAIPAPVGGDYFGSDVSISGMYAFVSSSRDNTQGADAGSVYIFDYSGGSWVQVDHVVAWDGAGNDQFGISVDNSGDRFIAGSFFNDELANDAGAAYIIQPVNKVWSTTETTDTISVVVSKDSTIWLEFSSLAGCVNRDSLLITLSPSLTPAIVGADTICLGDTIGYSVLGDSTFYWSIALAKGNFIAALDSGDSVTVEWTVAGPDSLLLYQVDSLGCTGYDTLLVEVMNRPVPIIDPASMDSICAPLINELYSLSGAASFGSAYTWFILAGNGAFNGGNIGTSVGVDWTIAGLDSVVLQEMDQNGCFGYDTLPVVVADNPIVSAGIDDTICPGDSSILGAGIISGGGFVPTDFFDFGEDVTSHGYTTTGSVGPGSVGYYCGGDQNLRVGNGLVDGSVSVTVAVTPNTDIIRLDLIVNWASSTPGIIMVDGIPAGTVADGTCAPYSRIVSGMAAQTADGQVVVSLIDNATGAANDGNFQVNSMTVLSGSIYTWNELPATFISNQDTISVFPVVPTDYELVVQNEIGCIGKDTVRVNVSDNPKPDLGPDDTVCFDFDWGINKYYEVSNIVAGPSGSYEWWKNGFQQFVNNDSLEFFGSGGGMVDTIILRLDSSGNTCYQYDTLNLFLLSDFNDTMMVNFMPKDTVCNGDTISLGYMGMFGEYYFKWFVNGVAVDSGDMHQLNNIPIYSGDLVTVIADSGNSKGWCPDIRYDTLNYFMAPPINANLSFPGDSSICYGDSAELRATTVNSGIYTWYRNALLFSGPTLGDTSAFYNFPGFYYVVVQDTFGCFDTTNTKQITRKNGLKVDLTLLLEGPYNGTDMNVDLYTNPDTGVYAGYTILQSQFEDPGTRGGPGFGGAYGITMALGDTIPEVGGIAAVDVIQLRFRSTPSGADLDTTYAWLMQDGNIRAFYVQDSAFALMCGLPPANYHVVVNHRNHLTVMTNAAIALSDVGAPVKYDLSNVANVYSATYGVGVKDYSGVGTGPALMIGGNAHDYMQIDATDLNLVLQDNNGLVGGYHDTDFDLSGVVNATDLFKTSLNNSLILFSTAPNP